MASWRENASPQAQQDLDDLLAPAIGFAQHLLAERGEFYPFAVGLRSDGELEQITPPVSSPDDHPEATDVLTACYAALEDRRTELRAASVVADVSLPADEDAIRIELEHVEGIALALLLPYARSERHGLTFGDLRATQGTRRIW